MIRKVIEITDVDEFVVDLKTKIKMDSESRDSIIRELREMKKKGQVFYEENYKGENKVRIFNKYNLELWDYIKKNSTDKFDGTAKINFSITSLLKKFDIKDTKENRKNMEQDIEEICKHTDFIVGDYERSYIEFVEGYSKEINGENFTIYLPWDKDRMARFFRNNKIIE